MWVDFRLALLSLILLPPFPLDLHRALADQAPRARRIHFGRRVFAAGGAERLHKTKVELFEILPVLFEAEVEFAAAVPLEIA